MVIRAADWPETDLPGVNDREAINDGDQLNARTTTSTPTRAPTGTTSITEHVTINGTVGLGGTENDWDTVNPDDTDTDVGNGELGGTAVADIRRGRNDYRWTGPKWPRAPATLRENLIGSGPHGRTRTS